MKLTITVVALALIAGVATAITVAGGRGPNDVQEIAAGVAVFTGLLAVAMPLLSLTKDKS